MPHARDPPCHFNCFDNRSTWCWYGDEDYQPQVPGSAHCLELHGSGMHAVLAAYWAPSLLTADNLNALDARRRITTCLTRQSRCSRSHPSMDQFRHHSDMPSCQCRPQELIAVCICTELAARTLAVLARDQQPTLCGAAWQHTTSARHPAGGINVKPDGSLRPAS